MRKFFSIVKNELCRYFSSSLAYVYLLAFLFLNASFTLYLGNFLERGEAGLSIMFDYLPWIYLIFISGIAMRLWSEEFKTKTVVQILTLPVSPALLTWGKFTAAWIFCTIGLLLTFPFVITVNILGQPDNGVIAAGYLSCFLLSGAMLSVAQTMSAITKNQVIALVLSVILNLLFFLSGMEYVLGFFRAYLPFNIVEGIASLSFLSHFNDISNGLIGLKNILFFAAVIWLFNFLTETIVRAKTSGVSPLLKNNRKIAVTLLIILIWLGFAGFNMISARLFDTMFFDVTKNKLFTLPQSAVNILENIKEPITAKIYYSPILSQRNPLFRKAADHIRLLMKTYQRHAGEKLHYRFYYPQLLNDAEDMAIHDKMTAIPLPDINQNAFFGISFVDEAGESKNIPLIPLENTNKVGQEILQNIYELSYPKPTVGILSSLPVYGLQTDKNTITSQWQFIDEMEKLYLIKQIDSPQDLNYIKALMIIHPEKMTKEMVEALKQYTLTGGKILILADIAAEAQRLYSPINHQLIPSDLNGLDSLWGFKFAPSAVIADLDASITVNTGTKNHSSYAQDVIQFTVSGNGINKAMPETKNLSQLLFASASPIFPLEGHQSVFTPLLMTTTNSALMSSDVIYNNINPADILAQFQPDGQSKTIAAKIVSTNPNAPFEVIVIGDSDFAYDDFWSQTKILDEHKYTVFLNDNINFVLNALDSLLNKPALIELRQSNTLIPRFEKWESLRKQNALRVAAQERKIFKEINQIKSRLNDLWQKKNFEGRQDFSDDELNIIAGFRQTLQALKQDLSTLRINQNENLKQKQAWVIFFNLYAIPLLLILGLSVFALRTYKHPKYAKLTEMPFTLKFWAFAGFCLLLFMSGVILIFSTPDTGNDYENKPVFPNLENQLNDIQSIRLEHQQQSLVFYKNDGIWFIKGYEQYPIYQRRIANLLAVLANTHYLERKSARAEYLPHFGLDAKQATTLTLEDKSGKPVFQFDIGRYDEEISRGGRGAFLKFTNKFQVWLVDSDFISLSTDWREWALSSAFNVRFGRVKQIDKNMQQEKLILFLKELINTPLTISSENDEKGSVIDHITLTFENDDTMTVYFEKHDGKNYIRYQFGQTKEPYLRYFASFAKDKRYEIPSENMEKINNVLNTAR